MSQSSQFNDETIPELPEELDLFAKQLGQFKPKEQPGAREELFFKAGQEAARAELATTIRRYQRITRMWQTAASVLLVASIGLGVTVATWHESPDVLLVNVGKDATPQADAGAVDRGEKPSHDEPQPEFIPIDRVRARQVMIAQTEESWTAAPTQSPSTPATISPPIRPQSVNLDSGSLLRGLPAQLLIRRMTEDSTL